MERVLPLIFEAFSKLGAKARDYQVVHSVVEALSDIDKLFAAEQSAET